MPSNLGCQPSRVAATPRPPGPPPAIITLWCCKVIPSSSILCAAYLVVCTDYEVQRTILKNIGSFCYEYSKPLLPSCKSYSCRQSPTDRALSQVQVNRRRSRLDIFRITPSVAPKNSRCFRLRPGRFPDTLLVHNSVFHYVHVELYA